MKKADDVSDTIAIQAKFKEIMEINNSETLDRATKKAKSMVIVDELNRQYLPKLPIGQDSMNRMIVKDLPKTIEGYKLVSNTKTYSKPDNDNLTANWVKSKSYFEGTVKYQYKSRVETQFMLVAIEDRGYAGKWFNVINYDWMTRDFEHNPIENIRVMPLKYQKTIDYGGQRWGQWSPQDTRPGTKAVFFFTIVNDRFAITAIG